MAQGKRHLFVLLRTWDGHRHHWNSRPAWHLVSESRDVGGLLTFGMSLVTLSFLITTPEVYVPNLGGDFPTPQYGFPYLSGAGRLVIKDVIMMGAGLIVASDSAKRILKPSSLH